MAVERVPRFADVTSIALQIKVSGDPVTMIEISGIRIECDLRDGVVKVPKERKSGELTEIYSDDVHQSFQASVEAALRMTVQMELLNALAALPDQSLQHFIKKHQPIFDEAQPREVSDALVKVAQFVKPAAPHFLTLFQPAEAPSEVKRAVHDALKHEDIKGIRSMMVVNRIIESIHRELNLDVPGPVLSK